MLFWHPGLVCCLKPCLLWDVPALCNELRLARERGGRTAGNRFRKNLVRLLGPSTLGRNFLLAWICTSKNPEDYFSREPEKWKTEASEYIFCRLGTLFGARLWNVPSLSDCSVVVHKSCKECAPVCTKVTSYTDLTRAYLHSKGLEAWWKKKENTHTDCPDPVSVWEGLQGCQNG